MEQFSEVLVGVEAANMASSRALGDNCRKIDELASSIDMLNCVDATKGEWAQVQYKYRPVSRLLSVLPRRKKFFFSY